MAYQENKIESAADKALNDVIDTRQADIWQRINALPTREFKGMGDAMEVISQLGKDAESLLLILKAKWALKIVEKQ